MRLSFIKNLLIFIATSLMTKTKVHTRVEVLDNKNVDRVWVVAFYGKKYKSISGENSEIKMFSTSAETKQHIRNELYI